MRELESVHEFESTVGGKFEWRWMIETGWAHIPGGQYVRTISQKVGKASMARPLAVMKLKGEVKIVISWR